MLLFSWNEFRPLLGQSDDCPSKGLNGHKGINFYTLTPFLIYTLEDL